jgi:hypothetical protein
VSTKTNFAERNGKLVVIHVREVITDALDKENVYEENYFFNLQPTEGYNTFLSTHWLQSEVAVIH